MNTQDLTFLKVKIYQMKLFYFSKKDENGSVIFQGLAGIGRTYSIFIK